MKINSTLGIAFIGFELLLENNGEILEMMKAFSNVVIMSFISDYL